jgi:predicted metal-dependent hydrolase
METAGMPTERDRIRDGLRLFNEEFFFEAHEVLEDVWHREHGEPRLFLQGLIQICAGFHHFQNENLSGAAALLQRGADKMRGYPDRYLDLDAADLLRRVDAARERVVRMANGADPPARIAFPKIDLAA